MFGIVDQRQHDAGQRWTDRSQQNRSVNQSEQTRPMWMRVLKGAKALTGRRRIELDQWNSGCKNCKDFLTISDHLTYCSKKVLNVPPSPCTPTMYNFFVHITQYNLAGKLRIHLKHPKHTPKHVHTSLFIKCYWAKSKFNFKQIWIFPIKQQ